MSSNSFSGTISVGERTQLEALSLKSVAKRIAKTMRCGLPGIITAFHPSTQYVSVQLAIAENLINMTGGGFTVKSIPQLDDVLLMLPGDATWCLTFPNIVGSECYVCFADMCINAWATNGFPVDGSGNLITDVNGNYVVRNQELMRRHDLSDGFAILAPRSQPNRIQNYSTNAVELRSMDNQTKIGLGNDGTIQFTTSTGVISGTPTNATFCFPVIINGVIWYMKVSSTP
jgi:hypothetical protein